jgi:cytochrome c oxidase subunit 2
MSNLPFFPPQASTVAGQVDLLLLVLILLSGFFTSIVLALIIYFGIRYRRGSPADRSNAPTTSLKIELGWIFGLLFLGIGTYTWAAVLYFQMFRSTENPLDIYVVGLQWMWKFQHAEGNSEINTLHVPSGQPVRLVMISEDVIHSFYVPEFRLKHDVLPGRYTNLWFTATGPGEYNIYCTEFCGTDHSRMIGKVIVMEARQYQDWLSGGQAEGAVPVAGAGEQLFTQLGCSSCHSGQPGAVGPPLAGLFGQTVTLEDGQTVTADENYIRESILLPQEKIVAGYEPVMPTYEGQISEEQLVQIVSYIRSLGSNTEADQENP